MSIEVNKEALEQLSIADLIALDNKFEEWNDRTYDECRLVISDELDKRIGDIFILD